MRLHDTAAFRRYVRMSPEQFDYLLSLVKHRLEKHPQGRRALEPAHRLAITLRQEECLSLQILIIIYFLHLWAFVWDADIISIVDSCRYLASGSYLSSVAYSFRIGFTTIKRIVYETCTALWEELMPIYLPNPSPDVWAQSAKQFEERWSFPNCIGAVDGKHIIIEAPHRAGSMFYNYKGSHSIVLMAVADAKYKFLYADIGAYGSQSDGGVFKSCSLGKDLEAGRLGLPAARRLPGSSLEAPYVFVGDEAFQLRPDFLRPFPGADLDDTKRVYNIRLSHARRCVENAFGILASRWRIFRRPINVKVENVDLLVQACVVLHNFLRVQEETAPGREAYCPPGFADRNIDASDAEDGQWRNLLARNPANALEDLRPTLARRFSREAASVRNVFADYFVSAEGAVSWQWAKAGVKEPL
ncbi:uncharacterized protein LOC135393563 [Ornithodoros turicata]